MYPWHKRKKLDAGTQPHHAAWLDVHPQRTQEWLKERLREGFDVHHIDGDHSNNDPKNLVLIEHRDHMMLHRNGTRGKGRLCFVRPKNSGRKKKRKEAKPNKHIWQPKPKGPRSRKEPLPDVSGVFALAKEQAAAREARDENARQERQSKINEGLSKWARLIVHEGARILVMHDTGKAYKLRPGEVALGIAYSISLNPRNHRRRLVDLA